MLKAAEHRQYHKKGHTADHDAYCGNAGDNVDGLRPAFAEGVTFCYVENRIQRLFFLSACQQVAVFNRIFFSFERSVYLFDIVQAVVYVEDKVRNLAQLVFDTL